MIQIKVLVGATAEALAAYIMNIHHCNVMYMTVNLEKHSMSQVELFPTAVLMSKSLKSIYIHMSSRVQALGQTSCLAVEECKRCSVRNERNPTLMKICRSLHG